MTPREIDALVAERIFGYAVARVGNLWYLPGFIPDPRPAILVDAVVNNDAELPEYSASIAAAFQVVEQVQRENPGWRFSLLGGDVTYGYVDDSPRKGIDRSRREAFGWNVEFHGHIDPSKNYGQRHADASADSIPLAICLAALQSVGVEGVEE